MLRSLTLLSKSFVNAELLGSGNIPQNTQEDYFKNLTSLWDTVEDEVENFELQGKTDWKMPKWAEGIFVTSGPSKQDLEGTKFGHIFDGFGRFSNVNFKDSKALFTSKMLRSDFYNRSISNKAIVPGMLFSETTPNRKTSKVAGANAYYFLTKEDNNWVQME